MIPHIEIKVFKKHNTFIQYNFVARPGRKNYNYKNYFYYSFSIVDILKSSKHHLWFDSLVTWYPSPPNFTLPISMVICLLGSKYSNLQRSGVVYYISFVVILNLSLQYVEIYMYFWISVYDTLYTKINSEKAPNAQLTFEISGNSYIKKKIFGPTPKLPPSDQSRDHRLKMF